MMSAIEVICECARIRILAQAFVFVKGLFRRGGFPARGATQVHGNTFGAEGVLGLWGFSMGRSCRPAKKRMAQSKSRSKSQSKSLFFSFWLRRDGSTRHPAAKILKHNLRMIEGFRDEWYMFIENFRDWSDGRVFKYFFGDARDNGTVKFMDLRSSVGEVVWGEVIVPLKRARVVHATDKWLEEHRGRSSKISDAMRWHFLEQFCRRSRWHLVTYCDIDTIILPHFHSRYKEYCEEQCAKPSKGPSSRSFLISTYERGSPGPYQTTHFHKNIPNYVVNTSVIVANPALWTERERGALATVQECMAADVRTARTGKAVPWAGAFKAMAEKAQEAKFYPFAPPTLLHPFQPGTKKLPEAFDLGASMAVGMSGNCMERHCAEGILEHLAGGGNCVRQQAGRRRLAYSSLKTEAEKASWSRMQRRYSGRSKALMESKETVGHRTTVDELEFKIWHRFCQGKVMKCPAMKKGKAMNCPAMKSKRGS